MKTSTKLLIVFFIALPITLLAYNLLMKRQYLAGNLVPVKERSSDDLNDTTHYIKKQLPQCKYVVVSGEIASGDFGHPNRMWENNGRQINIYGDHKGKSVAVVNKYYESLFKTRVNKDTLYIYFYRQKHVGNIHSVSSILAGLYLNSNVEYIRVGRANFISDGSYNLKRLTLSVMGNNNFIINNLQTNQLNLAAKDEATVTMNDAKNISDLSYSLFDSTKVQFNNCHITAYKPLHIDTAAKMDITIKGNAIQQYLTAKH